MFGYILGRRPDIVGQLAPQIDLPAKGNGTGVALVAALFPAGGITRRDFGPSLAVCLAILPLSNTQRQQRLLQPRIGRKGFIDKGFKIR